MNFITNSLIKTYIKNIENNLDDIIYPQDTFVISKCNSCYSEDAKCYPTRTPHPDFITIVCDKEECKEKARRGMALFLFNREVHFLLKEPIKNVKVVRSNGDIDNNWEVTGLWLNDNELPDLFIENKAKMITKNIRSKTFLETNPELEERLKKESDELIEYHMKLFDNFSQ